MRVARRFSTPILKVPKLRTLFGVSSASFSTAERRVFSPSWSSSFSTRYSKQSFCRSFASSSATNFSNVTNLTDAGPVITPLQTLSAKDFPLYYTTKKLKEEILADSLGIVHRRLTNLPVLWAGEQGVELTTWIESELQKEGEKKNKSLWWFAGMLAYNRHQNAEKALQYFHHGAMLHCPNSVAMVGKMYKEGGDTKTALKYSQLATSLGNSYGYVYSGIIHEKEGNSK